jgi:hypothetical protein
MAVPWGLAVVVLGFAYGALKPGRQGKGRLLLQGLLIGLLLAAILVVLDLFLQVPVLLKVAGIAVALLIVVSAVVFTLLFVLGVWLGDLVTGAGRHLRA